MWCRVVGESAAAEHDIGSRALELGTLDLGTPRGQQRIARAAVRMWREAERNTGGFHDRLPSGATAQVRQQRRLDSVAGDRPPAVLEGGETQQDARGAETALARA